MRFVDDLHHGTTAHWTLPVADPARMKGATTELVAGQDYLLV